VNNVQIRTRSAGFIIALSAVLTTLPAEAEKPPPPPTSEAEAPAGLPVAYTQRPLTGPQWMLSPRLDFTVMQFKQEVSVLSFDFTAFLLDVGASISVLDDMTIDVNALSLIFGDPETDYGAFRVGATYRFLNAELVELGGTFMFYIDNAQNIVLNPAIPVRIHAGDIFRLDSGLNFSVVIPKQGDAIGAMAGANPMLFSNGAGIPVEPSIQIIDPLWAGLATGFGIANFDNAEDAIFVPLGFRVGGTVPIDNEPIADVHATFAFPHFVFSGYNDTIFTDLWTLNFRAQFFIGL